MIGELKKKKLSEKKKKHDSRVKTRKGQYRAEMRKFSKTYEQSEQKNEKSTTRKHPKPPWVPQSLPTPENPNLLSKGFSFPNFLSLSRWVLTLVKLPYSETRKNESFKMLDFQRICFPKKSLGNVPFLCSTKFVKINLLSHIIRFQVNALFRDF